jgi:hypothetical protein
LLYIGKGTDGAKGHILGASLWDDDDGAKARGTVHGKAFCGATFKWGDDGDNGSYLYSLNQLCSIKKYGKKEL